MFHSGWIRSTSVHPFSVEKFHLELTKAPEQDHDFF